MKKFWKSLALLLCLLAGFGFVFTACGDGDDDNGGENKSNTPTEEPLAVGGNYSELTTERVASTAPTTAGTITVSGAATYSGTSIKEAWAAVKNVASGNVTVSLAAGTYEIPEGENLTYEGAANIKISGASKKDYGTDVVIVGNPKNNSTKTRELFYFTDKFTGSLTLEYVTIKNTYSLSSDCQAEVIGTAGSGNLAAYNCSFLSHQDTIRTTAKVWFYKCYIEGDTDFLWMEAAGTVALYEECVLRAVNDRNSEAEFTAPRANVQNKVGKGLVIYKSKLEAEGPKDENSKFDVYLGRNPWASSNLSGYYEQVAIVDSPFYGTLNPQVWKSVANGTPDQQYVGYKTDDYYAASTKGYGARLSYSVKNAEYTGRNNILNRFYNIASQKFFKDTETEWNIAAVIEANGWDVTPDTSLSLLDGETETKTDVYDFTSADANGYTETTCTGFALESGKTHAKGAAGNTISFPVTGKGVISVFGYYAGYGTIAVSGQQGKAVYNFNNGTTGSTVEKTFVNYTGAGTVTITAGTASYITKIVVEYDDSVSNTPVTGVAVKASSDLEIVGVAVTLSATITPDTATIKDVKWSTSEATVGTIDEWSGKVTFLKAGEVTFTATATDGSGQTNTITCNPEVSDWRVAEWYTTDNKLDAEDDAENAKYFSFGSSDYKSLGAEISFKNRAGKEIKTSNGLKLNSAGTLVISPIGATTLTVITYTNSNLLATPKVTGASLGAATLGSSDVNEKTKLNTYVYHLSGGDTWTIARGDTSKENCPLVYAEIVYDAVWDWANSNPSSITGMNIQGTTGTVASNIDDIALTVDATVTDGKLQYNSQGYAQFNNGTIIKVPVKNVDSVITTVSYSGQSKWVFGEPSDSNTATTDTDTDTYTVTADDVTAGYVKITATGGAYIYSISLTKPL